MSTWTRKQANGFFRTTALWEAFADVGLQPGTENAETWEYTLGFEHQLTATSAIGISAAYKKTTNMMGWYIADDGEFNWETIRDNVTGEEIRLMDYSRMCSRRSSRATAPGPERMAVTARTSRSTRASF